MARKSVTEFVQKIRTNLAAAEKERDAARQALTFAEAKVAAAKDLLRDVGEDVDDEAPADAATDK